MAQALVPLQIAGSLISAGGTILGANSQAKQLRGEAAQLEVQAGQERASSQRQAIEERRQGRIASSRALAIAAASGGGADDPSVINAIANIEGEGEYRALTALYEGNSSGDDLVRQAAARRTEAKNVKRAALFKAAGTIIGAGSSLADRYGGGEAKAAAKSAWVDAYNGQTARASGRAMAKSVRNYGLETDWNVIQAGIGAGKYRKRGQGGL